MTCSEEGAKECSSAGRAEGPPAALLLRTALLVYSDDHTPARAFSNAPEVLRAMLGMLSYSPAPDMPARSSTFAVLRTIAVASLPSALPALHEYTQCLGISLLEFTAGL